MFSMFKPSPLELWSVYRWTGILVILFWNWFWTNIQVFHIAWYVYRQWIILTCLFRFFKKVYTSYRWTKRQHSTHIGLVFRSKSARPEEQLTPVIHWRCVPVSYSVAPLAQSYTFPAHSFETHEKTVWHIWYAPYRGKRFTSLIFTLCLCLSWCDILRKSWSRTCHCMTAGSPNMGLR